MALCLLIATKTARADEFIVEMEESEYVVECDAYCESEAFVIDNWINPNVWEETPEHDQEYYDNLWLWIEYLAEARLQVYEE